MADLTRRRDGGAGAASCQSDRGDRLYLVAVPDAPSAVDAALGTEVNVRVGVVATLAVCMNRFELWACAVATHMLSKIIAYGSLDGQSIRIEGVVREIETEEILTMASYSLGSGLNLHAVRDQELAGRLKSPLGGDLYETHAAGAGWIEPRVMTERRDLDPEPFRDFEDSLARASSDSLTVYNDFEAISHLRVSPGLRLWNSSGKYLRALPIGNDATIPRPQIDPSSISQATSAWCSRARGSPLLK